MNEKLIKRFVFWIFIAGALVIVSGLGIALWLNFSDGPSPDVSDLVPKRVPIPDDQNGFLVLNAVGTSAQWDDDVPKSGWGREKVFRVTPSPSPGATPGVPLRVSRSGSGTAKPPEMETWNQATVDALLAKNEKALAMLDKALAMRGFQFEKIESYDQRFAYLSSLQTVARVKSLAAYSHWRNGQKDAAIEETFQVLELGRRIENGGGVMIHFLVGMSIEAMALNKFSRFANDASDSQEDALKSMISRFETYEDHAEVFQGTIRNEFGMECSIFDASSSKKIDIATMMGSMSPSYTKLLFVQPNNTRKLFAETFRQIIREAPLPYAGIDREPGMMKRFSKMSVADRLLSANNGGELLYTMAVPVIMSVDSKQYRVTTMIRMTRALLAVRCYWLDHGALPATLDDMVPAYLPSVPLDAFDGKPLRYSPTNKVIYSVGKDLMDKGGDTSDGNKDGDHQPTVKIEW